MICLDTNYLIRGLTAGTREAGELIAWTQAGEPLITPMPAWFEFLCGPVNPAQIATMRAFLREIVSFAEPQANEAARLFDAVRRKRTLRVDAMIAATATAAGATLATNHRTDFSIFVAHGLQLI
ncbi:MAG: type II toxin-antitoxin system VapC family toxin [Limisphaerales bacterium]